MKRFMTPTAKGPLHSTSAARQVSSTSGSHADSDFTCDEERIVGAGIMFGHECQSAALFLCLRLPFSQPHSLFIVAPASPSRSKSSHTPNAKRNQHPPKPSKQRTHPCLEREPICLPPRCSLHNTVRRRLRTRQAGPCPCFHTHGDGSGTPAGSPTPTRSCSPPPTPPPPRTTPCP